MRSATSLWVAAAIAALTIGYVVVKNKSATLPTQLYKLNKDDGGLATGTVVSYAGTASDLLSAVSSNSTVTVVSQAGTSGTVNASSLDLV